MSLVAVLVFCLLVDGGQALLHPVVRPAKLNQVFSDSVNFTTELILEYQLPFNPDGALRLHTALADLSSSSPLFVVVRHSPGAVLSWQLPLEVRADLNGDNLAEETRKYSYVNRTLCPDRSGKGKGLNQTVLVSFSTTSDVPVHFRTVLYSQETFQLETQRKYETSLTPSAPIFFEFRHPEATPVVLLKLSSNDDICMTLSVQNVSCPVFDLDRNVAFEGLYQTLDTKTGITFTRDQFPLGVFIVMVAKADNLQCQNPIPQPTQTCGPACRLKKIEFTLEPKISREEYLTATFGTLCVIAFIYVLVLLTTFAICFRQRGVLNDQMIVAVQPSQAEDDINSIEPCPPDENLYRSNSDSSLDETDIDLLADAELDKEIFRTKTILYLSDLARKSPRVLAKKSDLYQWNLLTIAIFYGLPVIQLMLTYQNVTNTTGNLDLCYYNFLCAHPLFIFTDFNHVFSNLGYVGLGVLFMGLVWRRDILHQRFVSSSPPGYDRRYGIPQHFGMYYAMGTALVMEGVMSGCYHVCPSHNNFQFDTAFMYTISILILLKIYQTRHPDINANAYSAFGALAFIIFVGSIGVLHSNLYFWIFFTILHVASCLILSSQIYYMGRCKLNRGIFRRVWGICYNDAIALLSGNLQPLKPLYPDRMILLLVLNVANWSLSGYGVASLARHGGDFASFLLAILISNVMLYTMFYIIMKLRHKERIGWQPAVYIVLAFVTWVSAMYFFLNKSTTWVLSPAKSKHYNRECSLLHFYDFHDIWHFLSAASLFLSFMILLTLDDDLHNVERTKIPVF